jgi:hypothetical protein
MVFFWNIVIDEITYNWVIFWSFNDITRSKGALACTTFGSGSFSGMALQPTSVLNSKVVIRSNFFINIA